MNMHAKVSKNYKPKDVEGILGPVWEKNFCGRILYDDTTSLITEHQQVRQAKHTRVLNENKM